MRKYDEDTLLYETYQMNVELDTKGLYTFETYIKSIFSDCQIECPPKDLQIGSLVHILKNKLVDMYQAQLQEDLKSEGKRGQGNKLRTYRTFKNLLELEPYLLHERNFRLRRTFSKLRLSNHKLEFETGRHKNIDAEERFCVQCPDKIGDEFHFIMNCTVSETAREKLTDTIVDLYPDFSDWDERSRFLFIMQNRDIDLTHSICKFVFEGMTSKLESQNRLAQPTIVVQT